MVPFLYVGQKQKSIIFVCFYHTPSIEREQIKITVLLQEKFCLRFDPKSGCPDGTKHLWGKLGKLSGPSQVCRPRSEELSGSESHGEKH